MGCQIEELDDAVRVVANKKLTNTCEYITYPGFPTDIQPRIVSCVRTCRRNIHDRGLFDNRFRYADELNRMGANLK